MTQNLWAYFNDIFGTGSEKSVSVSTAPAARRLSVTEMGDRVATIDMRQKVREGAAVPVTVGELGPQITQCFLG